MDLKKKLIKLAEKLRIRFPDFCPMCRAALSSISVLEGNLTVSVDEVGPAFGNLSSRRVLVIICNECGYSFVFDLKTMEGKAKTVSDELLKEFREMTTCATKKPSSG